MHADTTNRFLSVCVAGIVCGFIGIVATIGHGSLLFAGELRQFLPAAIGLALFSTVVMTAIGVFAGSNAGLMSIAQDIPVVALTPVVAVVAASTDPGLGSEARFATIIAAIAVATMATGAVTLALGHFRLGGMIRFTPFPVIAGFLAGTGWLITLGGIGVAIGELPALSEAATLLEGPVPFQIALTLAILIALVATGRFVRNPLAVPVLLLVLLVLFNVGVMASGGDYDGLRAEGWLIRLPERGRLWPPIELSALASVDWRAVAEGMLDLPVVVVVTVVALLMNATGIELHLRRDVDLDRELRASGYMNLVAGAGAGLPGYPAVSLTLLASQLGVSSRWLGLIVSALTLVALSLGTFLLDAVPAVLLGGILVWVGGSLMVEWLVLSRRRIAPFEYAIVLLIFAVVAFVSFPAGILVGLIAAVGLFAFEYGRVGIVRHEMSGADYQSQAAAPEHRQELLREHGGAIWIVRLQGFLFFGTADRLRRRVLGRMTTAGSPGARFLVIDFRRVSGMDSSAVLSFVRLGQAAESRGFTLVLAGLSERASAALRRSGLGEGGGDAVRFAPDLERGLHECEERLLVGVATGKPPAEPWTLVRLLATFLHDDGLAASVAPYGERIEVPPGARLIEQGARADDIFLIESGNGTVEMAGDHGLPVRLASVGPGAVVGEISFYLRGPRSASIAASDALIAWRYSRADLERLATEIPDAAVAFHQAMAEMLSRRLAVTNDLVRFLAD